MLLVLKRLNFLGYFTMSPLKKALILTDKLIVENLRYILLSRSKSMPKVFDPWFYYTIYLL